MIKAFLNLIAINLFILFLPVLCLMAYFRGSADERWLMGIAGLVLAPFCGLQHMPGNVPRLVARQKRDRRRHNLAIQASITLRAFAF